jgi:hypothetical protein
MNRFSISLVCFDNIECSLRILQYTPQENKKRLGQVSQSLQFSLSRRKNATLTLNLDVAYLRHRQGKG